MGAGRTLRAIADEGEATIHACCAAGRFQEGATGAVRRFGPEITSYLFAILRDEADTDDAFSTFTFMLWQSLARFHWQCSLRTWSYMLARRALAEQLRTRTRRRREVELSPELMSVADRVRSQTLEYLRTEVKNRMVELRAQLDPDDQTLLILRVDRRLAWPEIAHVMAGEEQAPEAALRLAASLRKRFERIKNTLRERVRAGV